MEDLLSQQVRQRRVLWLAWSAAGSLLVLAGLAGWQAKVALDNERLAFEQRNIAEQQRQLTQAALSAYEESLAILRKLAASDPGNAEWQRQLSASLEKLGDLQLTLGDSARALAAYQEVLAIRRRLLGHPDRADWQIDLALTLRRISGVSDQARAALREALAILERLARLKVLPAAQENLLPELRDMLAKLPPEAADAR